MKTLYITKDRYKESPWVTATTLNGGIQIAKHPLYCNLLFGDNNQYQQINLPSPDEIVTHKYNQLKGAAEQKDIQQYVYLHERPFRFHALLDAKGWDLPNEVWYALAGSVWVDSEGPGINASLWRDSVFTLPNSLLTMTADERIQYDSINIITIYRGADVRKHARSGLSWTTNKEQAIWFAKRFSFARRWLASTTIKQSEIAAFFDRRGEEEIIVASNPKNIKTEKII